MKEEVWNYYFLDKHRKTIEDKIAEGMYIWNDPVQDVAALHCNVKYYIVIINHHTQYTEVGVQDIAFCSACGWIKGDPLAISTISSMRLYPFHARFLTAYKKN